MHISHVRIFRQQVAFTVAAGLLITAASAFAQRSFVIETEAVNSYPQTPCTNCSWGDIKCQEEVNGFYNGLTTAPGTIWQGGNQWTENDVWDTDYTDQERPYMASWDDDELWFDANGQAMSYVCVHGDCDDYIEGQGMAQPCSHSYECTNPGPGMLTGACIGSGPPSNQGYCAYLRRRQLVFNGHSNNSYGGFLNYSYGKVALGEDSWSGTWGQAGTNGGINVALISNSCGIRPPFYWEELANTYAGATFIGWIMPVTVSPTQTGYMFSSDDYDAVERGTEFANFYRTNPNYPVAWAWVDSIATIPRNEGEPCPIDAGTWAYGGGHGLFGCGAQMAMSLDVNQGAAEWDLNSFTWYYASFQAFSSTGAGYYSFRAHCNYDCYNYPFTKP